MTILAVSYVFLLCGGGVQLLMESADLPSIVSLIVDAYSLVFVTTRNGLFEGFFYVALGMFFGIYYEKLHNVKVVYLVVGLIAGYAGNAFLSSDAHLPFCGMLSACVFLLSIRRRGGKDAMHPFLRASSTVVYLVHMLFAVLIVYCLFGGTSPVLTSNGVPSLLLFGSVTACSFAMSICVYALSKKTICIKWAFGL